MSGAQCVALVAGGLSLALSTLAAHWARQARAMARRRIMWTAAGILHVDGKIGRAEAEEIRRRFEAGARGGRGYVILEPEGQDGTAPETAPGAPLSPERPGVRVPGSPEAPRSRR